MSITRILEVQQGIWIDEQWIQSAGLGSRLQVIVQSGEIRVTAAPPQSEPDITPEKGWEAFRSLGRNARAGKLQNVAEEHDRYLYGKKP